MSTGMRRVVAIEYAEAYRQQDEVAAVFRLLKGFNPGVGDCAVHGNTLIGFPTEGANGSAVCLPGLVAKEFPNLVYNFDKYVTKV